MHARHAMQLLIVDEVSMLSGESFDLLEHLARRVRNSDAPFGGIQLVMCGDFLQVRGWKGEGPVRCPHGGVWFCVLCCVWGVCMCAYVRLCMRPSV
jgi:hypothetical protein